MTRHSWEMRCSRQDCENRLIFRIMAGGGLSVEIGSAPAGWSVADLSDEAVASLRNWLDERLGKEES